jgi:hypothetical protein
MEAHARESRTRRSLLTAGLGGLAAWIASALGRASPVRAEGEYIQVGGDYYSATSTTRIENGTNTSDVFVARSMAGGAGLIGVSDTDDGVRGVTEATGGVASGVFGYAPTRWGVYGQSTTDVGVRAVSRDFYGMYAQSTNSDGIFAVALASKRGVWGESASGTGVYGFSGPYQTGAAPPAATGVYGESASGIGGYFKGGRAQLKLEPKATIGKPASGSHSKGEIYMDSKGSLFVCSASGTPGTWRKVTTKLV